jgi:hypothetical protein
VWGGGPGVAFGCESLLVVVGMNRCSGVMCVCVTMRCPISSSWHVCLYVKNNHQRSCKERSLAHLLESTPRCWNRSQIHVRNSRHFLTSSHFSTLPGLRWIFSVFESSRTPNSHTDNQPGQKSGVLGKGTIFGKGKGLGVSEFILS